MPHCDILLKFSTYVYLVEIRFADPPAERGPSAMLRGILMGCPYYVGELSHQEGEHSCFDQAPREAGSPASRGGSNSKIVEQPMILASH